MCLFLWVYTKNRMDRYTLLISLNTLMSFEKDKHPAGFDQWTHFRDQVSSQTISLIMVARAIRSDFKNEWFMNMQLSQIRDVYVQFLAPNPPEPLHDSYYLKLLMGYLAATRREFCRSHTIPEFTMKTHGEIIGTVW